MNNAQQADSPADRRRLAAEFRSTLLTRLHPGGSVILIGTRWSESDLIADLLAEEGSKWRYVNVPAISAVGVPDALDRPPGVAMVSALGRTFDQFEDLKSAVGERAWAALYQGALTPPTGGLVKQAWLDTHRRDSAPARPLRTVVAVDPADSGQGDAAGIVAASLDTDGVVVIHADRSRPTTSDEWARAAVELALEVGASEVALESFSARETYKQVVQTTLARMDPPWGITITSWPPKGSGRGRGDALAGSGPLLQGLETGTVVIGGHLPELEAAAVGWQQGQHQPDQLAACVIAVDIVARGAGSSIAVPGGSLMDGGSPYSPGGTLTDGRRGVVDALAARSRAARDGDEATVIRLDEVLSRRSNWRRPITEPRSATGLPRNL